MAKASRNAAGRQISPSAMAMGSVYRHRDKGPLQPFPVGGVQDSYRPRPLSSIASGLLAGCDATRQCTRYSSHHPQELRATRLAGYASIAPICLRPSLVIAGTPGAIRIYGLHFQTQSVLGTVPHPAHAPHRMPSSRVAGPRRYAGVALPFLLTTTLPHRSGDVAYQVRYLRGTRSRHWGSRSHRNTGRCRQHHARYHRATGSPTFQTRA